MDDSRFEKETSEIDLLIGSVHAAEYHVPPRKAWIYTVVYVLHVEKFKKGTDGLPGGIDTNGSARIFPSELLAEYSRHSPRISPTWRPSCIHGATCTGSDARIELWNLRSAIRTLRKHSARSRQR